MMNQLWSVNNLFSKIDHYTQCANGGETPKEDIWKLLLERFC